MSAKTLFLAWEDRNAGSTESNRWFPLGRLDAEPPHRYRFRYIGGAMRAWQEVGLRPLYEFPDFERDYRSPELFFSFKNRVIAQGRPDRAEYLQDLDLEEDADPIEILSVNGGSRATDAYMVFPKIEKDDDGNFTCRFFMHECSYGEEDGQARIKRLTQDEELHIVLKPSPGGTQEAHIRTTDGYVIGRTPHYLVEALAVAMAESHTPHKARVVRTNHLSSLSKQRVLIETSGRLNGHEPMNGKDFQPLVD